MVCFSAPDIRQKISGKATHSISHGPVLRSWSATIASIKLAASWRTTEMLAWMYRHEIGLRFCGMVLDEPRPGAKGSNTSATSVCIKSFTSMAILPSEPPTMPRKAPTSAKLSRTVCQLISGWPRPSSCMSAAWVSIAPFSSDDSVPEAPPNSPTSTRGFSCLRRSRWRSIPARMLAIL